MAEKTLGEIARGTWWDRVGQLADTPDVTWDRIADAVVRAHEARRWRPIAEAPDCMVLVGKRHRGAWTWKQTEFLVDAVEDGFTHFTTLPAPPKEGE